MMLAQGVDTRANLPDILAQDVERNLDLKESSAMTVATGLA